MDRKRFEEIRRNVLDKFNNLEMMINLTISMFYFNKINKDFIFRVLNNPFFSSALRMDLFLKIIKDSNKKRRSKIESGIKQMSNIRNYFAHITPQYFDPEEKMSIEKVGWFPHPKDPLKRLDLEEEHEKFFKLEKEVHPYIKNTCKVLGVKFPVRF